MRRRRQRSYPPLFSVRQLRTFTKARTQKVWSPIARFEQLDAAIAFAQESELAPLAVFEGLTLVWQKRICP